MKNYRICTSCKIHHYENCGTCFGFGLYKRSGGYAHALIAIDALEKNPKKFILLPCTECNSTIKGIPK